LPVYCGVSTQRRVMHKIAPDQIRQALRAVGIQKGDGLLVHSAIQFLGEPEGGVGMYYQVLCDLIGAEGTLAVPTFNFSFAKSGHFDPKRTPSVGMGVFSEYVRLLPGTRRTSHPMQSLAVAGKYAQDLASCDTPGAFDDGSAFDRMIQLHFKLLLLGASIQAASIIHYSEQRALVPYRYWKDFSGTIETPAGLVQKTYRMYVRDLKIDPRLIIKNIQKELARKENWKSVKVNYGEIAACRLEDFVSAADAMLRNDPWVFVTNKPEGKE
jgi:aminoglycoside 3-N-acetyltransferase